MANLHSENIKITLVSLFKNFKQKNLNAIRYMETKYYEISINKLFTREEDMAISIPLYHCSK